MPSAPAPGPLPAVEVVGDADGAPPGLVAALVRAEVPLTGPGRGGVVVVAAPVALRAAAAGRAVATGSHVFVAWPPGSVAEAEALLRRAEEAGVEVGVELPLAVPDGVAGPARLVSVTLDVAGDAWPRHLAGVLDACARLAGSREATRLDAEAERHGVAFRAVAVSLRFRNGAFAQALVRAVPGGQAGTATVYVAGVETVVPLDAPRALADAAVAFVQSVAAGVRPPYPLDDALATMRLAERVMAALR